MATRAIYPLHGVGGLERHVYDLVRHVLKRSVRVTVVTRPPSDGAGDLPGDFDRSRLEWQFVPYRTFPLAGRRGTTILDRISAYPLFGWRAGRRAADLVRRGGVQIVHGLGASALGYASARRRDRLGTVPFVFNPQGLEEFGATDPRRAHLKRFAYRPLQAAVRTCARAADRVIATDRVLVPMVSTHLRMSTERIAVVPNGLDVEEIDRLTDVEAARAIRRRLNLDADDTLLLSVGRLEANKGFQYLIPALAGLTQSPSPSLRGRWRWVLLGEGPFRRHLERSVASCGLADHLLLPGRVSDTELHAWYEAAMLFIHPTLYEGSSIVTLEAMSHHLPVVATRAGGLPDKVRPGVNGWLVEPGDTEALTTAIAQALAQRDRLAAMGAESRAIVEGEFAWSGLADRLLELYDEVLSRGAVAATDLRA